MHLRLPHQDTPVWALISACMLLGAGLSAQDTHYWTEQFGTRSALMSGAVLGGSDDNTMIYYNPAALGFLENSSVSINANAYKLETIVVENALGRRTSLESIQLAAVPLVAGGLIKTENQNWKIGYAFVSPVTFDFRGTVRADGNFDLVDDSISPGLEETVAETGITTRTNELVFAMGLGHKMDENWSVGLSNLFTVRSHNYQRDFATYVFLNDEDRSLISANVSQKVNYYNVRYAAKLGLVHQSGPWKTGLTVTTPSLNLFGNGTLAANLELSNILLEGQEERLSGVATDRQEKLKTKFKSPFSVALGTNFEKGRSHVGVVVQYFAGIGLYEIMQPTPSAFVRPVDLAPEIQSDEFLRFQTAARAVVNAAIGYEYQLRDNVNLIAGFRTDRSYFDDRVNEGNGIKSAISSWDIYHFSGGFTWDRASHSLSLGLLFSAGSRGDYQQNGSFDPDNPNLFIGSTTITKAKYRSFGILLGYTFHFLDRPGADREAGN